MDVRSLLEQCRHAQEELTALRHQIDQLSAHGRAASIDQYRALLFERERETVNSLATIEQAIGTLRDTRARTVMRYYYTMGLTDAQIGEAMKITDEWVRKKRYAAVRGLERKASAVPRC